MPTYPHGLYHELDFLGLATDFTEEVSDVVRHAPAFEGFDQSEIETLCKYMHCFAAPANTILLQEGEEGDHLLLVLSGRVAVRKTDIAGRTTGIAIVGAGEILGEMSLIDGEHRFATCTTLEPTRFAILTRIDLNEIIGLHPRLANKFLLLLLQIMVGRLRDTGVRMVTNAGHPAI